MLIFHLQLKVGTPVKMMITIYEKDEDSVTDAEKVLKFFNFPNVTIKVVNNDFLFVPIDVFSQENMILCLVSAQVY